MLGVHKPSFLPYAIWVLFVRPYTSATVRVPVALHVYLPVLDDEKEVGSVFVCVRLLEVLTCQEDGPLEPNI